MEGNKVQLGNNVECDIVGVGDIRIRMYDGIVRILTRVRHVSDMKNKLDFLKYPGFNSVLVYFRR